MEQSNGKKVLIIDCDPGCDDALALLLAIRKGGYEKIVITTVAGNVPVERTTFNARKIATLARHNSTIDSKSIEVYRGSAISLMGTAPNVTSVHGRDGLGDVPDKLCPPKNVAYAPENGNAMNFYLRLAKESTKQYDLVCTGPLTNLANALNLSPDPRKLLEKFNKIVVMGGAFNYRGNITPTAEFNFFFDPIAVQIVLNTLKTFFDKDSYKKIVFVPLNVTEKVQLARREINEDESKKDEIGKWTLCMLQKYFRFHAFGGPAILKDLCANYTCSHDKLSCCTPKDRNDYENLFDMISGMRQRGNSGNKLLPTFCYLHDPLAVYYAVFQWNITLKPANISVHTGNDEMRGTVIVHDPGKVSLSDRKAYTKGTDVQYLSPENIPIADIIAFKKVLFDACGLK